MPLKGTTGVYRITNTVTGDCYIGSSNDIGRRWAEHRHRLARETHDNLHLQRAWLKYGPDAFSIVVLETCTVDRLIVTEQASMDAERPTYNMSLVAGQGPGMTGKKHSAETLAKMSQRVFTEECRGKMSDAHRSRWTPEVRGRQARYAANMHTPDSIAKRSQSLKGHPVSELTRQRIGLANRGRVGQAHSEETRQKMSASQKIAAVLRPPMSEATRRAVAEANRGKKRGPLPATTREKIRQALTGRKLTPEHREKVRQNNLGRIASDETRRKMSEASRGRRHTDEARAKISAALKGRPKSRSMGHGPVALDMG